LGDEHFAPFGKARATSCSLLSHSTHYTDRVLFGEVWPGTELSQRDRRVGGLLFGRPNGFASWADTRKKFAGGREE
jgi:hypothetical protein